MAPKRMEARPRTTEELAEERAVREHFANRPSIQALIERGDIDPERIMTGSAEESLLRILVALNEARRSLGLSLSEVARRSGIDLATLNQWEGGKDPNPTFETLSRYAEALGLRLELSLIEVETPAPAEKWSLLGG
jgi:DNA-binding phage protein